MILLAERVMKKSMIKARERGFESKTQRRQVSHVSYTARRFVTLAY